VRRRPLLAAAVAGLALMATGPGLEAHAAGNTLRVFVYHLGPLQSGSPAVWRVIIQNSGPGVAAGFGASGRFDGVIVSDVDCPLALWGGIGSLSNFFECGNNGGYRGQLRAGQSAIFGVSGNVTAPVAGRVTVTVTGLAANGDVFVPTGYKDIGVVVARSATATAFGAPAVSATPSPTASASGAGAAATVGSGAAYSLLLAAAFVVSGAGLFYVFTRRRLKGPPSGRDQG
jgi:hypothetical protein